MKITVAGTGCGSGSLYTEKFKSAVKAADKVFTAVRDVKDLEKLRPGVEYMSVSDTLKYIDEHIDENVNLCICASGDTGFYSIAKTVAERVRSETEVEFLPGIGSLSYFCAKLGTGYENMKLVSLHGNGKSIVPFVCYNEYVFALTGGKVRVQDMADSLIGAGFGDELTLYAGENLSLDGERIVTGTPGEIAAMEFSDLAVVVIHNPNYVNRYKTLRDSDFLRAKVPMTKEAVRTIVVSELDVMPEDTVWDIGAGTGSVTCALCYRACESTVYAIEKNPAARELIEQNAAHTGARNMKVACGTAPDDLTGFPAPDKVFIGGSSGRIDEIFDLVLKANPKAVICATAVTLESLDAILRGFKDRGMEYTVKCVNVSSAEKLGAYHLMKAENPVYILKGSFADNE